MFQKKVLQQLTRSYCGDANNCRNCGRSKTAQYRPQHGWLNRRHACHWTHAFKRCDQLAWQSRSRTSKWSYGGSYEDVSFFASISPVLSDFVPIVAPSASFSKPPKLLLDAGPIPLSCRFCFRQVHPKLRHSRWINRNVNCCPSRCLFHYLHYQAQKCQRQ